MASTMLTNRSPLKKPKKTTQADLTKPSTAAGLVSTAPATTALKAATSTPTRSTEITPATNPLMGGQMGTGQMSIASTPDPRVQQNQENSLNTKDSQNPFTGFASRYDPSQVNSIYSDPSMILRDLMTSKGLPLSNSRMAGMGPAAENAMNLAGLLSMATGGSGQGQDDTLINTIAELLNNQMGAGGTQTDLNYALQLLMNPASGDAGNPLRDYLYGAPGDKNFGLSEQNQALQPLFQAVTAGANPYLQQGMASAYRGATQSANDALGHGLSTATITNYLRKNLHGFVPDSVL